MDDPNNPAPVSTPAPAGVTFIPEQLARFIRGEIEKATAPLTERLAAVEGLASRTANAVGNHDDTISQMAADDPVVAKRERWLDKIMYKYFAHDQPTDAEMADAG